MSIRFLATIQQHGRTDEFDNHSPQGMDLSLEELGGGMRVAINEPDKLLPLPMERGFVIGTLFPRNGPSRPVKELSRNEAEAILQTKCQHLIDRYWGRYIAVIRADDNSFLILRDPSGTLPCLYMASLEDLVLASDASAFVDGGWLKPEIDAAGLARALLLDGLPEEKTALANVRQILPGTCLHVHGSRRSQTVRWNPWSFISIRHDCRIEREIETLQRVIQTCVSGWGSLYGRALLGVSGGLDSSIVAACLREGGNDFSCVTLATDDPLGDERSHARSLASHVRHPLFEARYSLHHVDLDKSSVSHLATPSGRLDATVFDKTVVAIANEVGAQAIFTGNGGDNVFYMSHSARPLADRYFVEGLSPGLLLTLRDICKLTGATYRQVLLQAVSAWRQSKTGYVWRTDKSLLSADVVEEFAASSIAHPWLTVPEGYRLPGKAAHIAMLLRMHYSLDAYKEREGIPVLHPLASQPIVECCLDIPSWHQCEAGRDRSVARRAFEHVLPPALTERKAKGSPQGFTFEIFQHYRNEIRERLLDGYLVNEKLVDSGGIEQMLLPNHQRSGKEIMRLLMLVDTEAWVKRWRS
jgi:asparagine synthase (glutamine-hydrolysing)